MNFGNEEGTDDGIDDRNRKRAGEEASARDDDGEE